MQNDLQLSQIAVVILAKNHNPSILNPDFLRINGIVPDDWEVDTPTFSSEEISQVTYRNGFQISMDLENLIFLQFGSYESPLTEIHITDIACKYLAKIDYVNYYALGINPIIHIPVASDLESQSYIKEFLLKPGEWNQFLGVNPVASVSLAYKFNDSLIRLSISAATAVDSDNDTEEFPVILFSGNIHRNFDNEQSNTEAIKQRILNLSGDLETYFSLIRNCFLNHVN
jgi:hypothetical protein